MTISSASRPPADPRLPFIENMMDLIKDGYYATQVEEGARVNFLRIKRPTKGNFKNTLKLMTQHGPRFKNAVIWWPATEPDKWRPEGRAAYWEIMDRSALDYLMLVVADAKGCARLYSKLGHCCQCNTELTDPRSRHYGIGPDCEKNWPEIIEEVDDENDGKSFEQLQWARR